MDTDAQIQHWRDEFPITERLIYLNNCSLTPLPKRGATALAEFARTWTELGGRAWFDHWVGVLDALRGEFAQVLGADTDEIALEPTASAALVTIASTFDYSKRNKIVIADIDFPTDGHTWLALERQGVEVEFVRSPDRATVPLELFERAVDDRTALVCTGHVYYTSGSIQDVGALAQICHRRGAALVVDGYQSIGAFPFDVHASNVDFLVGGTLKWLMGGPGMAFLYARRDRIAAAHPTALGWWAMADPFTFDVEHIDLASTARRFEYGTPAVAAAYTARAGLALLAEVGIDTIRRRHIELSQQLVRGAQEQGWELRCPVDPAKRTPIVTLAHPDPARAVAALRAAGCITDYRPGIIRLSPHHFNTAAEIERTLELLAKVREAIPVA
ncbi:MAG TPA: aminotransferase class V-fold PLP-dependent enzyme [Candidatus Saccharimonadales bacterium]|nr:aminotransferase class V-fold PLP-dependent enzyme [Candidatus Saccharimonadales bacterium]